MFYDPLDFSALIRLALYFAVSVFLVLVLPLFDHALYQMSTPSAIGLEALMVCFALFTGVLFFFHFHNRPFLSFRLASFMFLYNILLVFLKFGIVPLALYSAAQSAGAKASTLAFLLGGPAVEHPLRLLLNGSAIFVPYFLVWGALYLFYRRKIDRAMRYEKPYPRSALQKYAPWIIVGGLLVIFAAGSAKIGPMGSLLVFANKYIPIIFGGTWGIVTATTIGLAAIFAVFAFRTAAIESMVPEDADRFSTIAWMSLALMGIYHFLWLIYLLLLSILWPF